MDANRIRPAEQNLMWGLIIQAGIVAAIWGYHRWIENHPKQLPANGVDRPMVAAGTPVPLIYGSCRVRNPILAWSGNFNPVPLSDFSDDDLPGFQYQSDMFFVVGIPFEGGITDSLVIYSGDVALFLHVVDPPLNSEGEPRSPVPHEFENPTAVKYTIVGFPAGQLLANTYGGLGVGGGVGYRLEHWKGDADQQIADGEGFSWTEQRMVEGGVDSTLIPGYRRQVAILLYKWSIGESPNITPYSFALRSMSVDTPSFMGNELEHDACPAAVLFDLIVSKWGKLGLGASVIDLPSFQAASLTLFTEGHGYSRAVEASESAESVIGDVLKQTDGMIYQEPTTGKIVYKLIRNDYSIPALPDINPGNMQKPEADWYTVQGWNETFNQVRLTFTDREADYADGQAIGQNMANIISQGGRLRPTDVRYVGCCTAELAQKLASRELAVLSRPSVQATVTVNRSFYATRPGDVVTLTWPDAGIDHMIMRVARVDLGQLGAGGIKLDLIRDIFDVSIGAFPVA